MKDIEVDLVLEKDFRKFFSEHKEFVEDKFKEALGQGREDELNLDMDLYQERIDSGCVSVFSLYIKEEFVGYLSLVISPDFLRKGKISGYIDHFALDKEYRNKGIAKKVLSDIENFLKDNEVRELSLCFPATEEHKVITGSLGYKPDITFYKKSLRS